MSTAALLLVYAALGWMLVLDTIRARRDRAAMLAQERHDAQVREACRRAREEFDAQIADATRIGIELRQKEAAGMLVGHDWGH